MVFHHGKNHFVSFLHELFAETGHKQVDAFRRPPRKHDLIRAAGIDEAPHRLARSLMQFRSLLREKVHSTMHVRIHQIVLVRNGIHHATGLLRSRPVIEIDQRFAIDLAGEDGEIGSYLLNIHFLLQIKYE